MLPQRNRAKAPNVADWRALKSNSRLRFNYGGLSTRHQFDDSTGQIFSETTTAIQSSDDRDWAFDGHLAVKKKKKGTRGSRTLQDAAIECLLQNIVNISFEAISCLPIHIVQRLWIAVYARCTMCLNTWVIFARILRGYLPLDPALLSYQHKISQPRSALNTYSQYLTSTSFEFITSLIITAPFPTPQLLKLSSITNLGVLSVTNPGNSQGVGDYMVRAWHLAVLEEGAFRVLRVLRLWGHEGLTSSSVDFIHAFPALAVYDVKGPNFSFDHSLQKKSRQHGWNLEFQRDLCQHLDHLCQQRAFSMQNSGAKSHPKVLKKEPGDGDPGWKLTRRAEILAVVKKTQPELTHVAETTDRAISWDLKLFNRIGELRHDTDLKRAGIDVGDHTIIGDELVNNIPVASFSLGSTKTLSTTAIDMVQFTFYRIDTPSSGALGSGDPKEVSLEPQAKRHGRTMLRKSKKQKVDDVLNSFG